MCRFLFLSHFYIILILAFVIINDNRKKVFFLISVQCIMLNEKFNNNYVLFPSILLLTRQRVR